MAKEFFKNLPDTTTPLEASRLNGLLDGEEAMGNIVVDSIRSKNMFDKNSALINYELNGTDGSATYNNAWFVSAYIPIKYNVSYTFSGKSGGFSYCLYDSSKTFVQTISGPIDNGTISIPNNSSIKYLRINARLTSIDTLQIEEGTTATNYSSYRDFNNDITSYTLSNTPTTGVTNAYSIHRIGNSVTFNCDIIWISSLTANTWITIGNIPISIYPTDGHDIQTIASIIDGNTGNIIGTSLFQVKTTGEVRIKPNVAYSGSLAAGIIAYASWIINR